MKGVADGNERACERGDDSELSPIKAKTTESIWQQSRTLNLNHFSSENRPPQHRIKLNFIIRRIIERSGRK